MHKILDFLQGKKSSFLVIAVLLFLFMILFSKVMDGSHQFVSSDSLSPKAIAHGMEAAKSDTGKYPLWMPWIFSGLPSVHSFQYISRFYIPHQFFLAMKTIGIPWFWTFSIHMIFAGFGVFLLLRFFKITYLSSIFGSISFMLTPYLITMIVHGHGSQMMTAAYIPWILWSFFKLTADVTLKNSGVFALFAGLQLSRAHVQIAYYTWLMIGFAVLLTIINVKSQKRSSSILFAYLTFALILSVGFAMDIYYPVSTYTPFSIRGTNGGGTALEYATQWSFSFPEMMTFIIPSFFGFGGSFYQGSMPFTDYPNYMGILVLILAVYGSVVRFSKIKLLLVSTIVLSILLSFGKHFFLYGVFFEYFPYFNKFRVPVMILILTQFSVSVLAAFGLDELMQFLKEKRGKLPFSKILTGWVVTAIVILITGKLILHWLNIRPVIIPMITSDGIVMIVLITVALILIQMFKMNLIKSSHVLIGFIILSSIDLLIVDKKIIEPDKNSGRHSVLQKSNYINSYLRSDETIKFLNNDHGNFRIFPLKYLMNENRWAAFQIESITGYHPAKLANYNKIMTEVGFNSPAILQMLNVKYIVSPEPLKHPDFEEVFRGPYFYGGQYPTVIVYKFLKPHPRYYFSKHISYIPEEPARLQRLKQRDFNPQNISFISSEISENSFTGNGEIRQLSVEPDKIVLETTSDEKQFLVFSEIYYPEGWVASVNSKPVEIYETNEILRGIQLPAGKNRIEMEFNPRDILTGKWISRISFLLIALLILSGFIPSKKNV